jgi:FdrA protein
MQLSERVRRQEGVEEAILMMATDNNKKILLASGIEASLIDDARADDLVVCVVANTELAADAAIVLATEQLVKRASGAGTTHAPRTLDSALATTPAANMVIVSVPGQYATREARRALEKGLHVLLFSDNVELDDELALKQLAREEGLLLMGPDCGTAILNGVGLGFANAVRRGNVGIVGASGTGIQEISVLLHRMGLGVSQAIGTGGRDLKEAIGGITMLMGLQLLVADPATEVIILTSKPPAQKVARAMLAMAAKADKPVLVNFLGAQEEELGGISASQELVKFAPTLEKTALLAASFFPAAQSLALMTEADIKVRAGALSARLQPGQRYVRGLYAGGTLCFETLLYLQQQLGRVYSNIAVDADSRLENLAKSSGNTLLDMGEDAFTVGRAHPMIDPTLRMQRILQEAADPDVALLLLDLVLGFGAHEDPATLLVATLREARKRAADEGRYLPVIVSVCGTEADSQILSKQISILHDADILVSESNAEAARLSAAVILAANSKGSVASDG